MKKEHGDVSGRQQELDEFWDISSLVVKPAKKESPGTSFDVSTAEITLSPRHDASEQTTPSLRADQEIPLKLPPERERAKEQTATPSGESVAETISYTPKHPLIENVTLVPWRTQFPYYERFCRIARELFSRTGERCDPEPFFSYMPQYDQMNRAQLAWYLYWREEVRKGNYLKTGYCYIFLLLFEIINLPDLIPPPKGLSMLCQLWTHYREDHPSLDRYLCEWICDYCLLHRLPAPIEQLESIVREPSFMCQLREFYVHAGDSDAQVDAEIYMSCCSNYDYKKSRFYTLNRESAKACDTHIPAAMRQVLQSLQNSDSLFSQTKMQSTTMTRDTFVGALCSHRVKYKIGVRYRSFSRSHELRFFITDVIKYSENKLRALLGYKSRLSIYALSEPIKNILNAYFAQAYPKNHVKTDVVERPEYEKLYDLPSAPISKEQAERIEQDSWRTTQRLVEAFDDENRAEEESSQTEEPVALEVAPALPVSRSQDEEMPAKDRPFSDELIGFLRCAYDADLSAQRAYCRSLGKMPETLADAINEIASDVLGDILLEEDDAGAYRVIDDYRQDAESFFA